MSNSLENGRPITPEEAAVIRAALQRASVSPEFAAFGERLADLRVVDRCPCGCASVDFEIDGQRHPAAPLADGTGTTPREVRWV